MRPEMDRERVLLKRNALLRIHAIARKKIVCARGCVWLTQEGDRRDFVLCPGATFAFDRAGIALAWATGGDAMLVLDEGLRAEHVQNDAPSGVAAAATLLDAIDAIVPRYDTRELAAMSAGMRNAIVQREARRLRAQVAAVVMRSATLRIGELLRRLAASLLAPLSTRTALRRAE